MTPNDFRYECKDFNAKIFIQRFWLLASPEKTEMELMKNYMQ